MAPALPSNIAFVFPGQGAEFVGMAEDYCRRFEIARHRFSVVSERMKLDLRKLMACGPPRALAEAWVAQPIVFTMSTVIATLFMEHGVVPSMVVGHSLGQFSAVTAAGALEFSDGLELVISRGRLLHECNELAEGGMMAIDHLERHVVQQAIAELQAESWISNYNAPTQFVVSGRKSALWELKKSLDPQGGNCRWLSVPGPAHSPLMAPAAEKLAPLIAATRFRDPVFPVIAGATGEMMTDNATIRSELSRHMLAPVDWVACLDTIRRAGVTRLIEAGPGRVLKGLALRNDRHARCLVNSTVHDFEESVGLIQREIPSCASL